MSFERQYLASFMRDEDFECHVNAWIAYFEAADKIDPYPAGVCVPAGIRRDAVEAGFSAMEKICGDIRSVRNNTRAKSEALRRHRRGVMDKLIPKRFRELEHRWLVQDNTHKDRYRKGPLFKDELDLYNEYKQMRIAIENIKAYLRHQPHTPIASVVIKLKLETPPPEAE